ncbi:aldehyde dehydrogenase family protein [Deinococcus irradiatisoli]|uniref:Aldehyde dehydrogenase n=2 Tax=Deinococcus irradiatisoli TaxID=2202254 RepID=A0A2Z3JHU7_9DEIO|nr:aldehyde dehydrogenase family protein [Deinococcus irradiatisoli]
MAGRWTAAQTTVFERRELLRRLGEAVKSRRAELAEALRQDLGKSRAEAEIIELHPLLEELRFVRRHLGEWMRPRRVRGVINLGLGKSEVQPQARGVVLILGPSNLPVNLNLVPLIGALAAGNCVMLKPSEKAPATARALRRLLDGVFPPGLVSVVEGGPDVAEALLKLPFDHIFFTGSPAVGRKVLAAAAETLTSTTLELGGKSPALIDQGGDLPLAAERIAWGKFLNAGQSCIAPDYLMVHETLAGELMRDLVAAVERQYSGPRWQRHNPDYGRLIDSGSVARLRQATGLSVQAGARIEYGGVFDEAGRFVSPTLVSGVRPEMPLMQRELFGPVLPVLTYRHLDEALALLRSLEPPLALYLFGGGPETERRVQQETTSGGLVIGGTMIQFVHPHLPFGGVRHSGQGRYHGEYSFRTFSHERAVVREPAFSPVRSLYPPYGRVLPRLTAWGLRKISE